MAPAWFNPKLGRWESSEERTARLAAHAAADLAWERAWHRAESADRKAGRPYNRHVYAEKAARAGDAVLAREGFLR